MRIQKHQLKNGKGTGKLTTSTSVKLPNIFTDIAGITYYRPYYTDGHQLMRNAQTPEVVIKPDNLLSPAERNKRERERQRNHDTYYGLGTYSAMRDQENTQANILKTEKEWENSTEHKLLKAAEAVAQGVGIGADIVSTSMGGVPVYSTLKGSLALNRAVHSGNGWDYAESALWLSPLIGSAGKEAYQVGKNVLSDIYNLYKNYPIRQYNIESILKSDFYKNLSEQYGKEFADDFALKITSQDFRKYFFGNNPRLSIKEGNRHAKQMLIIKDVEDAGGILSGSGQLARNGTVHREGLLHDLDFNIPGNIEEGKPFLDSNLGFTPYYYQKRPVWTTGTVPINTNEFSVQQGYVNVPMKRDGIVSDMFVRKQIPNKNEIVDVILDAKRRWGRPKDLADIEAFTPYSSENPIINLATGEGQWNPTLFDKGIFTFEGYPYVLEVELYPGSGIKIPVVMNSKGQIRSVVDNTGIPEGLLSKEPLVAKGVPQITEENAASMTPKQWTAAQDAAIARGDWTEALRLRDLHFKVSTPGNRLVDAEGNPVKMIHGSQSQFTEFKHKDNPYGTHGRGMYFGVAPKGGTTSYGGADGYTYLTYLNGKSIYPDIGIITRDNAGKAIPNDIMYEIIGTNSYDEFINSVTNQFKNKFERDNQFYDLKNIAKNIDRKLYQKLHDSFDTKGTGRPDIHKKKHWFRKDEKYATFNPERTGEVVVRDANQIKLADAVTYDPATGERIPLGKRDDFSKNSILWGLTPFGIGLTEYGLYNRKQGGKMFKFEKGNKIHIKKANRGKFTDYCGGEVTNECILRGKHSSNPAVRKRATFAANARKWKHKKGGILKGQSGLIFPKSTTYSEIPKKLEISRGLFSKLVSMPLSFRESAARLNLYNRFDPSIRNSNLRVEKGITRSFNAAKKSLINWYLSNDYARRLNRARQTSWLPSFVLQSNDKIVGNLVDRVNNVSLDFDSGNQTGTNGMSGSTYSAVTVPDEHKIYFNRNAYNKFKLFPGNIFGTSSHELSHDSDRVLPRFALNYNHSLIKLNPNLSADVRAYYGDDSEIRARAVDTITNFNELRNKYKSLDLFVDKNLDTIPALKQLSNTFDSKESMMNYLKNFVYNDNSTNDYSNLNDDGVLYSKQGGIVKADDGVKFTLNDGINLGLNLYGTMKYNNAIDNQVKALDSFKDYYKNSIVNKKYKDNITKGFAERLQLPNSGTVINSNPDIDKHFYYTQAVNDSLDELNEINRSLELLKLNLQAQKKSILSSAANTALNYNNYDFG